MHISVQECKHAGCECLSTSLDAAPHSSTLFKTRLLLFTAAYTRLSGPSVSGDSISACHLLVEVLQIAVLLCPAFTWALGIWTPVIRLTRQANSPSPVINS